MGYKTVTLAHAKVDIREIAEYYNSGEPKNGKKFTAKVRNEIARLIKKPTICEKRYRDVRLCHLKKFPYSIHYIIDEERERIVIIAVFSMQDDPQKWERRYQQINK